MPTPPSFRTITWHRMPPDGDPSTSVSATTTPILTNSFRCHLNTLPAAPSTRAPTLRKPIFTPSGHASAAHTASHHRATPDPQRILHLHRCRNPGPAFSIRLARARERAAMPGIARFPTLLPSASKKRFPSSAAFQRFLQALPPRKRSDPPLTLLPALNGTLYLCRLCTSVTLGKSCGPATGYNIERSDLCVRHIAHSAPRNPPIRRCQFHLQDH